MRDEDDARDQGVSGGTGNKLSNTIITLAGVAALVASLLSFVSIWLQSKNYRKPLLQRYVIRILLMVPIYSASSWVSLVSINAATYLDPLRDIYEAFTIYTFFQLLINFLGGERSLLIMMHGRPPTHHPWPLNHWLSKVDISDPYTFLAIKRGILQYAWLKPILGISTIIMKLTGVYTEGDLSVTSGYLWLGILYNLSVTLSLYSLAMFWVCMSKDLKPFRPVPKFLCIKLIIFASYWQGFFLSILQWLGAIPNDVPGYSADNLAAAIQDALISFEMPIFAVSHWYAFSWHDYADVTISSARMPVKYALRDAFGFIDLIQDTKETFAGSKYEYRAFDASDDVMTHEDSDSRVARMMAGMRYDRTGKRKYWIPKPGQVSSRTPLLNDDAESSDSGGRHHRYSHGTMEDSIHPDLDFGTINPEDERLYNSARALEFGDWNYPVVTAHVPSRELWIQPNDDLLSTSTNQNLLQPNHASRRRSEHRIEERLIKGKHRASSSKTDKNIRAPVVANLVREASSSSSKSAKSGRSQLVDLTVEDSEAEQAERVRARKEGGATWNVDEPRHFVRTYDDEDQGEDIRQGFDPGKVSPDFGSESANEDGEPDRREETSDSRSGYNDLDDRNVWRGSPSAK